MDRDTFTPDEEAVLNKLKECEEPDWDGEGARAIFTSTVKRAIFFTRKLRDECIKRDIDFPEPMYFPSFGGEVSLEWDEQVEKVDLLVTVPCDGDTYGYYGNFKRGIIEFEVKGDNEEQKTIMDVASFMEKVLENYGSSK